MKIGFMGLPALPDPYRSAFRSGAIHTCPGKFFSIPVDMTMHTLFFLLFGPFFILPPVFIVMEVVKHPMEVFKLLRELPMEFPEILLIIGVLLFVGALLSYLTLLGYTFFVELYLTVQEWRSRQHNRQHYGLLLDSQNLAYRVIDAWPGKQCLLIPKTAVRDVVWKPCLEPGKRNTKWVDRTIVEYHTADGKLHWTKLCGNQFSTRDRKLYEAVHAWWKSSSRANHFNQHSRRVQQY
ncbi:MAG: hypothetical protein AAGG53_16130 [Cyanobacteria bacterium P01_H01_bin.152]